MCIDDMDLTERKMGGNTSEIVKGRNFLHTDEASGLTDADVDTAKRMILRASLNLNDDDTLNVDEDKSKLWMWCYMLQFHCRVHC